MLQDSKVSNVAINAITPTAGVKVFAERYQVGDTTVSVDRVDKAAAMFARTGIRVKLNQTNYHATKIMGRRQKVAELFRRVYLPFQLERLVHHVLKGVKKVRSLVRPDRTKTSRLLNCQTRTDQVVPDC